MLILTRKRDESLILDNQIMVKVLEITESGVRLGIDAPRHIEIHRKEIFDRIQEENRLAQAAGNPLEALKDLMKPE